MSLKPISIARDKGPDVAPISAIKILARCFMLGVRVEDESDTLSARKARSRLRVRSSANLIQHITPLGAHRFILAPRAVIALPKNNWMCPMGATLGPAPDGHRGGASHGFKAARSWACKPL